MSRRIKQTLETVRCGKCKHPASQHTEDGCFALSKDPDRGVHCRCTVRAVAVLLHALNHALTPTHPASREE